MARSQRRGARSFEVTRIEKLGSERFVMNLGGLHGLAHWKRVHENGLYLAKHAEADLRVVQAFAFLHDCCREGDGHDPDHGRRAAEFARLNQRELGLETAALELLCRACEAHEKGRVSDDPTVGVCWDSDRLDLGRVGIKPDARYLSTERAKSRAVIDWGYQRSRGHAASLKQ